MAWSPLIPGGHHLPGFLSGAHVQRGQSQVTPQVHSRSAQEEGRASPPRPGLAGQITPFLVMISGAQPGGRREGRCARR